MRGRGNAERAEAGTQRVQDFCSGRYSGLPLDFSQGGGLSGCVRADLLKRVSRNQSSEWGEFTGKRRPEARDLDR